MILSGQQYLCKAGETFDSVSLMVFRDEKYACELMSANPRLISIPVFTGGELLNIPVVDIPRNTPGEYMTGSAPWKED